MIPEVPAPPPGYRVLRQLSQREGSWVYLASSPQGRPCCLKLQRLTRPEALTALADTRRDLSGLPAGQAFIPLRAWGMEPVGGILWEELDLADDLLTERPLAPGDAETYTPLTLAHWVSEHGPVPTRQLLEWGAMLAEALESLHARGLYHRDVKPVNILIHGGRCVLADYGSVGQAGSQIEFPGTEGYVPPDGLGSPALDVFALGRTLYEAWTGRDRFHFPSLPASITAAEDWQTHGWLLNQILVNAADGRPSHRYSTARQLREALQRARSGHRRISRRKALGGLSAALAAGTGAYVWRQRPPYRATWRRVSPKAFFGYEYFQATEWSCDWATQTFYSFFNDARGILVHQVNLATWDHEELHFPPARQTIQYGCLTGDHSELWGIEQVTGRVHRFHRDTKTVTQFGSTNMDDLGFTGLPYWNTVTGRLGRFAGYGNFQTNNRRHEFDPKTSTWSEVKHRSSSVPWPRSLVKQALCARGDQDKLLLVGGLGNPSGKQSDPAFPQLKSFDGNFGQLNDIWELDLETDSWREILPPQRWFNPGFKGAVHHAGLDQLVLVTGSEKGYPQQASLWLHDLASSRPPLRLANSLPDIPMFNFWAALYNPNDQTVWVFAGEGVYSVSILPN